MADKVLSLQFPYTYITINDDIKNALPGYSYSKFIIHQHEICNY